MASSVAYSWRCATCRRFNAAGETHCGACWKHWKKCYDKSFQGHPQERGRAYDGGVTDRSGSPRSRKARPAQSPKPRSSDKDGKGKGKGKTKEPVPPWVAGGSEASGSTAKMTSPPNPMEAHFRSLVKELKKLDAPLTPTVQRILDEATAQQYQEDTKWLHSAVAKMGHAKKQLHQACDARQNFHQKWGEFLQKSVERWRGYVQEFAERDTSLEEQITKAQENLALAKAALQDTKVKKEFLDDDEEDMPPRQDAGMVLKTNLESMLGQLDAVKSKAQEAIEEQTKKRARLAEGGPSETIDVETEPSGVSSQVPAPAPFARAGQ